jgi:hypothetical protein
MSSKLYINFLFFLISKKKVSLIICLLRLAGMKSRTLHIKPLPDFGGSKLYSYSDTVGSQTKFKTSIA